MTAVVLAIGVSVLVSKIFNIIRGTRTEEDKEKILSFVKFLTKRAPGNLASVLTAAFVAGAERKLTGTNKELIRSAAKDGWKERQDKDANVTKVDDVLKKVLPGKYMQKG